MKDFKIIDTPIAGKVCVVVGTRPGIIKMSPIIKELEFRSSDFFVIHAGQHYSVNMDKVFFQDLRLPDPKYRLDETKNYTLHGEQTAVMLTGIEKILIEERPETVLVCGDANFNLAGALAARKLRLKLGHVEAGLRSYNWKMPEEHNRVIIDHISDYLFTTSQAASDTALGEGVRGEICNVGSTIVDALSGIKEIGEAKSTILHDLKLESNNYFLLTSHREENVDNKEYLEGLLGVIDTLGNEYGQPIVYPIHPRTMKRITQFDLRARIDSIKHLSLTEPLGYIDCMYLLANARLVLTDSGGLQQEACIFGVPCVTLRTETEWVETVEVGANIVAGTVPENIITSVKAALAMERNWQSPFGEIGAASRIIDIIYQGSYR